MSYHILGKIEPDHHPVSQLDVPGDKWLWGSIGCSVLVYCQFLAMNASALFLSAFTVERYIAICHPMKAQVAPLAPD